MRIRTYAPECHCTCDTQTARETGADCRTDCFQPASELVEHETGWTISFDLPGMKQSEIEIQVEQNVLQIKGERQPGETGDSSRRLHGSRRFGSFSRTYRLTNQVDQSTIRARMENGVLQVELSKTEEAQAKNTRIDIN